MEQCPVCCLPRFYAGYEMPGGIVVPKIRCHCRHYEWKMERTRVGPDGQPIGWHTEKAREWREQNPSLKDA